MAAIDLTALAGVSWLWPGDAVLSLVDGGFWVLAAYYLDGCVGWLGDGDGEVVDGVEGVGGVVVI
ncbi:MAG: hypothetical protein M3Y91_14585, partial [Actinomycetota bacterium]|nr:hypothetical protein [Actinomycetota bacterium]